MALWATFGTEGALIVIRVTLLYVWMLVDASTHPKKRVLFSCGVSVKFVLRGKSALFCSFISDFEQMMQQKKEVQDVIHFLKTF
jgi:hypothetical protein